MPPGAQCRPLTRKKERKKGQSWRADLELFSCLRHSSRVLSLFVVGQHTNQGVAMHLWQGDGTGITMMTAAKRCKCNQKAA